MVRVESLMKNYSLLKEYRFLCLVGGLEFDFLFLVMKKKVYFYGESKENIVRSENFESYFVKFKCRDLKKRFYVV